MITFPCKCGNLFEVPDDQSGGLVQCTRCGLLADVPNADDLPNLHEDGTFAFEETTPVDDGIRLADLHHAFTNRTTDDSGRVKDLRPTAEHFERIGVVNDDAPTRVTPRYDPVTGELIRPLALKDEPPMRVLPIAESPGAAAKAPIPVVSLTYSTGDTTKPASLKTLAVDLLQPANTTVMAFIYLFYVAAYLAKIPLNTFVLYFNLPMLVALVPNIPLWLIAAHYGCVIEDTGPDAIDELPRPMRFFEFVDDLLRPWFKVMLAVLICFLPAYATAAWLQGPAGLMVAMTIALLLGGAVAFPGVLLTSVAGTTVLNLSPDRLLGVMRICGIRYFAAVFTGILSLTLTALFLLGPASLPPLAWIPGVQNFDRLFLLLPGVAMTIYISHFFTWHLGLLYRQHHDQFPWLAQRHLRTPR